MIELIIIVACYSTIAMAWRSNYDRENFNCVDMSEICGDFFNSIGVPVQEVRGSSRTNGSSHCWLLLFGCVEFEATTLEFEFFDKPSDRYNVYSVKDI